MKTKTLSTALAVILGAFILIPAQEARAASAEQLDRDARNGLRRLYANNSGARALGQRALAVLVFPKIIKGGFIVAAQYGEGALFVNGHIAGYYSTAAGSYGFQAGVEQYGYAMFFMTESSLRYLHKSRGWEVGVGPTVVVGDQAFAKSVSSTTLRGDVYAFFFRQQGIMAGMGLQGTKITRIYPD